MDNYTPSRPIGAIALVACIAILAALAWAATGCMDTTEVIGPEIGDQAEAELRLTGCASYADTNWNGETWARLTGNELEGLACGWDLLSCAPELQNRRYEQLADDDWAAGWGELQLLELPPLPRAARLMPAQIRMSKERMMGSDVCTLDVITGFDEAFTRIPDPDKSHWSQVRWRADLGNEGLAEALRTMAAYIDGLEA